MGKSTISMAIFNSYVSLPEGKPLIGTLEHPFILLHCCPFFRTESCFADGLIYGPIDAVFFFRMDCS